MGNIQVRRRASDLIGQSEELNIYALSESANLIL
jgi:hypothetical protein